MKFMYMKKYKYITKLSIFEQKARLLGNSVVGIDEVNVCSYVGPIIVCAVKLPKNTDNLIPVADSKTLTEKQIEYIANKLKNKVEYKIAEVPIKDIDNHKMLKSKYRVIKNLVYNIYGSIVLIDYNTIPEMNKYPIWQIGIKDGDKKCWCIAAASILAKDYWNNWCKKFHKIYPEYNLINNKGSFGNQLFNLTLKYGLTKYHRKNWILSACKTKGLNIRLRINNKKEVVKI